MGKLLGDSSPTMVIPSGTKIEVDEHGQLSIRTPGNLVIQNSGVYGRLESISGSIRIESDVDVEAVSIHCAGSCYVQGSLTAWQVTARAIHLEDRARAHVVLQQTDHLQVGRHARLVGNFGSENELFALLSRFAMQLKGLPLSLAAGEAAEDPVEEGVEEEREEEAMVLDLEAHEVDEIPVSRPELPDDLFFALVLLEREEANSSYSQSSRRVLHETVKLLREREMEALRLTYRTLFARIVEPTEDLQRARQLIQSHFAAGGGGS